MRIDLHTHSSISDGTDSPTVLVLKAQQAGLGVIALCDHDTFDGIAEADEATKRAGVMLLPGMEMSTDHQGHDVHLLVYGADPWNQTLTEELGKIRAGRSQRLERMLDQLSDAGIQLSQEQVMDQARTATSLGRPHVADAMVAAGYVLNRDEAFAKWLDAGRPGYVERYRTPTADAIDMVHEAGGVAVIAHPWFAGGQEWLNGDVLADFVRNNGLDGIEVDNPSHTAGQRALLFEVGARLGLIRTGGSDYHGLKRIGHDLGSATTRESAYRELLARIDARGGLKSR